MIKYKANNRGAVIFCIKEMDSSFLPPCSCIISEKTNQTNYICNIWNNAIVAKPPNFQPKNCGWILEDNKFKIKWFKDTQGKTTVK